MKKVLALVLSLLMVFSLLACGQDTTTAKPSAANNTADANDSDGSAATGSEPGFYDPSFDYSANPTYKIVYMMSATGVLYDMFDKAFAAWSEKANVDYSSYCANNDNDLFLTTIETYAVQGVDGFLMDADNTIYPRVSEVVDEVGLPWMAGMAEALDENGQRCHPCVGFNNYKFGEDMAQYCIDYAKTTWPDAEPSEIGLMSMDYSLSPQIHERTEGAKEVFLGAGFPEANFIVVDGSSSGALTADAGFNLAAPTYSSHSEIKYWLICTCIDDYADGAARAAEQAGIDNNCVVTTCGGSSLINHWDANEESCWKSAIYCSQTIFGEPIFFALYSFMSGTSTPESIFPEWIDTASGDTYAYVQLPTFAIEKDTYKEYLEWVDSYTGINWSNYDSDYHGTQFDSKATPSF